MPLPQLRTDYNVLVPDRAKSSRDAVNALLGVQNMQARTANEKSQMENALVKRQEEKAAAERKVISDDLDLIIKKANLGKTIAEATPEVREKIIKLYPEFDGVKAVGEDITIPYQNFGLEISGNQHNVSSFLKKVGENPELATNNPIPGPIKATGLQHLRAIAAAEGVTLKAIDPSGEKDPEFKKRIDQYMKVNPGLSEKDATDIILGTKKLSTNPVSGEKSVVDMQTNISESVKDAPIATEQTSEKEKKKLETTLWELSGLSTGPWSSMRAGASLVSGALGGPVAEQTLRARQFTTSAQNDLIRALTLNKRFPVGEINRLKDDMAIEPNFFDNPKMLQQRYIAIEKYLKDRVIKEIDASSNTSLPKDVRQDALRAANSIDNFVNLLGVPDQSDTTPEEVAVTITSDADFDNLESGTLFIGPDNVKRRKP